MPNGLGFLSTEVDLPDVFTIGLTQISPNNGVHMDFTNIIAEELKKAFRGAKNVRLMGVKESFDNVDTLDGKHVKRTGIDNGSEQPDVLICGHYSSLNQATHISFEFYFKKELKVEFDGYENSVLLPEVVYFSDDVSNYQLDQFVYQRQIAKKIVSMIMFYIGIDYSLSGDEQKSKMGFSILRNMFMNSDDFPSFYVSSFDFGLILFTMAQRIKVEKAELSMYSNLAMGIIQMESPHTAYVMSKLKS